MGDGLASFFGAFCETELKTCFTTFLKTFFAAHVACGLEHVLVVMPFEAVVLVTFALEGVHFEEVEALLGLSQSRHFRVGADEAHLEVAHPLVEVGGGLLGLVELADAQDVVLGEDVVHGLHPEPLGEVAVAEDEEVAGVDAFELALPVVEVVVAHAEVEVEDVDGEDFLDVLVVLAGGDVLGDGLGGGVEDTFEEVEVIGLLDLDEDDLAEAVLGLDIDAVELVLFVLLVALAFEEFGDGDVLAEDGGDEPLEDGEVGLVA